jgi:uncharacterized membrane protein YeaQ/YmgE (transglycosylase-associated protein family)
MSLSFTIAFEIYSYSGQIWQSSIPFSSPLNFINFYLVLTSVTLSSLYLILGFIGGYIIGDSKSGIVTGIVMGLFLYPALNFPSLFWGFCPASGCPQLFPTLPIIPIFATIICGALGGWIGGFVSSRQNKGSKKH